MIQYKRFKSKINFYFFAIKRADENNDIVLYDSIIKNFLKFISSEEFLYYKDDFVFSSKTQLLNHNLNLKTKSLKYIKNNKNLINKKDISFKDKFYFNIIDFFEFLEHNQIKLKFIDFAYDNSLKKVIELNQHIIDFNEIKKILKHY
tara:strand:- start:2435 stop:2875 length:441 start_codon:yes stop_codon:yes gene_type:complete